MQRLKIISGLLVLASWANAAPPSPGKKSFSESIGLELVRIPAGSFTMGSPETFRAGQPNERPQHKVTLTRPFLLGKHEVTQAQWEAVMRSNPYTLDRSNPFYNLPGMAKRITKPTHPATVSWNDAQEFIKRLNAKEGHDRFRLPTEAEWEYAARVGTNTAYSFGDNEKELSRYAWHGEDFQTGGTHPVGQKEPNPWGLYDVHGNAWEWVSDWYGADYFARSVPVDPRGPSTGSGRVVRGGSWHVTSSGTHSSIRKEYEPDYRGISIGFRLARSVD
jgi:formylglycine-generating enzyme required for sulfatase activity